MSIFLSGNDVKAILPTINFVCLSRLFSNFNDTGLIKKLADLRGGKSK